MSSVASRGSFCSRSKGVRSNHVSTASLSPRSGGSVPKRPPPVKMEMLSVAELATYMLSPSGAIARVWGPMVRVGPT